MAYELTRHGAPELACPSTNLRSRTEERRVDVSAWMRAIQVDFSESETDVTSRISLRGDRVPGMIVSGGKVRQGLDNLLQPLSLDFLHPKECQPKCQSADPLHGRCLHH